MFRPSTTIRELVQSLEQSYVRTLGKLCPYRLCGGVAACLGVVCVLCAVQNGTAHNTHAQLYFYFPIRLHTAHMDKFVLQGSNQEVLIDCDQLTGMLQAEGTALPPVILLRFIA
jgi:hypothetical protein